MKSHVVTALAFTALAICPQFAKADALETLESFHKTAPIDWPTVPQTGPKADQVKQNLTKVKLPPGVQLLPPAEPVTRQVFTVSRRGGDRKPAVRVVLDALGS